MLAQLSRGNGGVLPTIDYNVANAREATIPIDEHRCSFGQHDSSARRHGRHVVDVAEAISKTEKVLANLCQATYHPEWTDVYGWSRVDNGDGGEWVLFEKQGVAVLAFRGSVNIYDWFVSDAALLVGLQHMTPRFQRCLVHVRHFAATHPTRRFIVTGHSLGGSLAIHAGTELDVESWAFAPGAGPMQMAWYGRRLTPQHHIRYVKEDWLSMAVSTWDTSEADVVCRDVKAWSFFTQSPAWWKGFPFHSTDNYRDAPGVDGNALPHHDDCGDV